MITRSGGAQMLGSIGLPEILFILVLALLVFGPKRLPKVGRTLGRALGEFRRATSDLKQTIDREMTAADLAPDPPAQRRPPLAAVEAVESPPPVEPGADAGARSADDPSRPADAAIVPDASDPVDSADSAGAAGAADAADAPPEAPVARTEIAVED